MWMICFSQVQRSLLQGEKNIWLLEFEMKEIGLDALFLGIRGMAGIRERYSLVKGSTQ
jgi:hypothetical protein